MKCERCHQETNTTTMSRFNTQMICMSCEDAEMAHPDYKRAVEVEREHVLRGDYNFQGIGLPTNLR